MSKMRFVPGDKVRIISNDAPIGKNFMALEGHGHSLYFSLYDIVTIDHVVNYPHLSYYKIQEDCGTYIWDDEWFEPAYQKSLLAKFVEDI